MRTDNNCLIKFLLMVVHIQKNIIACFGISIVNFFLYTKTFKWKQDEQN